MTKSCAWKKSDMAPCVITDGDICYAGNSRGEPICVGCGRTPEMTGVDVPYDFVEKLAAYLKKSQPK